MLWGLVIDGVFLIIMAFATVVESPSGFFVASVLIRLVGSIGFSMCLTSSYPLLSVQFPDKLHIVVVSLFMHEPGA